MPGHSMRIPWDSCIGLLRRGIIFTWAFLTEGSAYVEIPQFDPLTLDICTWGEFLTIGFITLYDHILLFIYILLEFSLAVCILIVQAFHGWLVRVEVRKGCLLHGGLTFWRDEGVALGKIGLVLLVSLGPSQVLGSLVETLSCCMEVRFVGFVFSWCVRMVGLLRRAVHYYNTGN